MRTYVKLLGFLAMLLAAPRALATKSAELLTAESYGYGRVEARVRFAPGDGVVSSVFLWKDGSERAGTFWNELDFEKLGANCRLETNPIYGNPSSNHSQRHALEHDLCGAFHTYAYEWTPEAIVWLVDGVEIRRETGATAQAFAENASAGMQIHFNLWPGDMSFGGNFSPASLPVHEYVDWVQFSAYREGAFELAWREDFDADTVPEGWLTGDWPSPKNKSTHAPENVNFIDGYAVLSLTSDDALGPAGAMPEGSGGTSSPPGTSAGGTSGTDATGSALGARPNAEGCSIGRGSNPSTVLAPLAALALAFWSHRRRRDVERAVAGQSR
jgi:endo-1,3-1,4-beta-glycanase ExoK